MSDVDLQKMPKVGELAPDFQLPDDSGNVLRLSDLCREHVVLLLFYPADFGMICSVQMGELRDMHQEFLAAGVMVLPLGTNSIRSHAAWKESMRLPFPLLADDRRYEDRPLLQELITLLTNPPWPQPLIVTPAG